MGIQGMELCAMAVVVLLFIAVLKQFGILEPISMEGNLWFPPPLPSAWASVLWGGSHTRSGPVRLAPLPRLPPGSGGLGLELRIREGSGPRSLRGDGAAVLKLGMSEMPGGTLSCIPGHVRPVGPSRSL